MLLGLANLCEYWERGLDDSLARMEALRAMLEQVRAAGQLGSSVEGLKCCWGCLWWGLADWQGARDFPWAWGRKDAGVDR